jgi:hypothetical protein
MNKNTLQYVNKWIEKNQSEIPTMITKKINLFEKSENERKKYDEDIKKKINILLELNVIMEFKKNYYNSI